MISLCSTVLRPQNKLQAPSIAHTPLSCCLLTSWNSSRSLSTLRSAPATPTSYGQRPSVWLPPHPLSLLIGLPRADHHYHHLVCSACACVLSISLPRVRIWYFSTTVFQALEEYLVHQRPSVHLLKQQNAGESTDPTNSCDVEGPRPTSTLELNFPFHRASLVAQTRDSAWNAGNLGWEDSLEERMATHSSILAWRIPWTEEPGGLQSIGSQSRTRVSD